MERGVLSIYIATTSEIAMAWGSLVGEWQVPAARPTGRGRRTINRQGPRSPRAGAGSL